ncbi:hypothetical protein [Empedobacter tilapiae]|uniref:Uncharacterized protein n=1 Tax=Empedobacter tilapiae TaxID=2491114 RepID=A0A4Z1C3G1_9FLAO|nr:hypothetical protein [Empedobacter tilapiae]TGN26851.1 hypothetical protein E4J94_10475 [Empedobacter tilapiae]
MIAIGRFKLETTKPGQKLIYRIRHSNNVDIKYDNTYGIVIGSEGIYSLNITDISKFTLNTMTKRELNSFWNKLYIQYDADWKNAQSIHHNETESFMINLLAKFYDQLGISLFRYDKEKIIWD